MLHRGCQGQNNVSKNWASQQKKCDITRGPESEWRWLPNFRLIEHKMIPQGEPKACLFMKVPYPIKEDKIYRLYTLANPL